MEEQIEKWKRINVPKKQVEYIEKLLKNPRFKIKYSIETVPEFYRRAFSEFIKEIEKEIEF